MTENRRRLYRSRTNKVFAGICGGLAEYFNADVTIVRLAWVLLTLAGGSGIILYIIAAFIIPNNPDGSGHTDKRSNPENPEKSETDSARIFGILFIAVGAVILLDNLEVFSFWHIWDVSWEFFLPSILIILGLFLILKRNRPEMIPSNQTASSESEPPAGDKASFSSQSAEQKSSPKSFYRSRSDKKIFGICGGAGEYFGVDPTILRVAYALFTFFSVGVGVILYLIMYLIIPEEQPIQNKQ
ncbi:MAG: PspC domain-containing protein [Bacteroidetes bacterium]|nr:PspC domain-containing protein [Bacteroidota bacterium]